MTWRFTVAQVGLQAYMAADRWRDIDLESGGLIVRRALQRQQAAGLVFVEPKSRASRRAVVLSDAATSALREHRRRQVESPRRWGMAACAGARRVQAKTPRYRVIWELVCVPLVGRSEKRRVGKEC